MTRSDAESLRVGASLGRYRIIERIGAGGMGEVYRARDLDLDRDVAVKVLPSDVTASVDRVRRFVQEAKAASGLNHPNIVVIHDIGVAEMDGAKAHFIAMEYIDGESLHARIRQRSPRDLKTLLGYAAQAADALAKAHAAGIIHRDLKPDNIMVTRDGFAKVLDFGLAKLTEPRITSPDDATATQVRPETREGVVMGTIGYMSPEQAEGGEVDARSDIFSFGCILYEIATGTRAFTGASYVDVLHAVVHDDPRPITDANPSVPPELRRIIRRCLAKDREQRFQSMKDLANTLRDLVDEYDQLTPGSGAGAAVPRSVPRSRLPWTVAAIAIIGSALLGAWALTRRNATTTTTAAETKRPVTLTGITSNGKAASGVLSPDGRYLAYNLIDREKASLRVRQLATGSEMELFPPASETQYLDPRYSPDGNYIYVRREKRDSNVATLVSIPTLGGEPRELVRDIQGRVTFSPGGKQIAFVRRMPQESQLVIADADGANERVLLRRGYVHVADQPAWSPDGKWIAAAHRDLTGGLHSVLLLVSPDGKTVRPFGRDRWFFITRMEWLPDMSAVAMTAQLTPGDNHVWLVSYPDGVARRVTSDLSWYGTISAAADGKSMVATQGYQRAGVQRVDVATGSVQAVTDDRLRTHPDNGFSVGNDGRMYFQSNERGTEDIWAMDLNGTRTQLTALPGAEFFPAITPAQDAVYYQYEMADRIELHTMTTTGAARRVVARLPQIDGLTVMSPDGRFVLISASTTKVVVPLDGGPQKKLDLPPSDARVALSPDSTRIAGFFRLGPEEGRRFQLAILPLGGGAPLRVFETAGAAAQSSNTVIWTEDGRRLAYIDKSGAAENVWLQPVDGGAPRPLTRFTDDRLILAMARGPANTIYVVRGSVTLDIVRITDFR